MRRRFHRHRARPLAVLAALGVLAGVVPQLAFPQGAQAIAATGATAAANAEEPVAEGQSTTESAMAQARRSGKNVEVTSLRGETTDVFATPDGDLEAREYLRPVRVHSANGWKDIDTSLAKTSSGAVAPKATTVGLEFSGGGQSPLVKMTKAGRELSLSWPTALPAPVVDGDTATYPDVLPGVDLRMGAQEDGFTQLLVVKSAEAATGKDLAELRLKVVADGMQIKETDIGGLQALDNGAGGAVFEAPKPVMWDSSGGSAASRAKAGASVTLSDGTGHPEPGAGESGKLADVGVEVPQDGKELILTPDADVLKGEDTEYPVFIDPQWHSPPASAWTMASEYWASSPQWKFNGESDAGLGFCNWSYCKPNDTKRLFYRMPVSRFSGKSILSAEFVVRNTWSASCGARKVQLWQTKGISNSTTWNSQKASGFWIKQLAEESFAYGYSGCSAKDAEFSVKSAVQTAANNHDSTMTFGLKAADEGDAYGWKRFSDDAYLRVKYNRPPRQIRTSQLTMEYGGTCKDYAHRSRSRSRGMLHVNNVTDPDGDKVSVQFQAYWDGAVRWKPGLTTAAPSGEDFSIMSPVVPTNTAVSWYVRAYDGAQYSPWSSAGTPTSCYYEYDTDAPGVPSVTSADYPKSGNSGNEPWYDGVGQYGDFHIKGDSQVSTYWYGINTDPTSNHKVSTTGGAERVLKLQPPKPGGNFITVKAFDVAGNASAPYTYYFRVKRGQPDRATWQLDEGEGATEARGATPARELALQGGVTLGGEGVKGTAVQFNGIDGYASTDLSPVSTIGGFAVSTWVKFDQKPTHAVVVATQPGNVKAGYELYYSTTYGWVFNQHSADNADATSNMARESSPTPITVGKWTHLVGSYSSANDLLQLYVDGKLAGEKSYATPWSARRGLQIGAGSYAGVPGNFFPGVIDETALFDKPLAADEVERLNAKQTIGDPGRPAIAEFPMDEAAGASTITGHGGVLPAKYNGSVTTGVPGMAGKATHFDGSSGYAKIGQTSGPHINTAGDFTISAWARLDKAPSTAAVVAAQAGKNRPGFELYYSSAYKRWAFNQYSSDAPDASIIRAMQKTETPISAEHPPNWTHLVGVHDKVADTLTLYVNGEEAGSVALQSPFYADQSMYIGAGNYSGSIENFFPGTIDDVRLLSRPVSPEEVRQMFRQRPLVKGRWNFESATVTSPVTTPDLSSNKMAMGLYGGAKLSQERENRKADASGLQLDGVTAYAAASTVPVDTSGSFTITAWARAAAVPDHPITVVSAAGATHSPFAITYQPATATTPQAFEITLPDKDTTDATVARVTHTEFDDVTEWKHLALVYDGFDREVRLYVDGEPQQILCDEGGDACEDIASWADQVLTFKASKSLEVGRSRNDASGAYFAGSIDDVWAFQGALTESQVQELVGTPNGFPTDVPAGSS